MYLLSTDNTKRGAIKIQNQAALKQIDPFFCVFFEAHSTFSPYFANNFDDP
jgi:hypothetical protein